MSFTISYIIEAQDRFTAVARKLSDSTRKMSADFSRIGRELSLKLAAPIGLLGVNALKASSTVEQLTMAFNVLLQSSAKGSELMETLSKFTLQTTYQLPQIAKGSKIMLGFGMSLDEVKDSLEAVADVASGTNIPFEQMAGYLGRVAAMGHLTGRELYMMGMVGVPVSKTFSKELGITSEQFTKLVSEGKITLPVFLKLFKQMTEEGGAYYHMAQKQSETLAGRWSVLRHELFLINKGIGDTISSNLHLKSTLASVSKTLLPLAENFQKVVAAHPFLTKIAVDFGAIAVILPPLLIIVGTLGSLIGLAFSPVALTIMAIAAGIGVVIFAMYEFNKAAKAVANIIYNILEIIRKTVHLVSKPISNFMERGKYSEMPDNSHIVGGMVGRMIYGNESNATVDVNLNAPQGTIKDIKSTNSGFSNLNLGKNMVKATI